MPQQRKKKERSERLRGERDQIKAPFVINQKSLFSFYGLQRYS